MAVGTHSPDLCEPRTGDIGRPPRISASTLLVIALLTACGHARAQEMTDSISVHHDTRSSSVYFGIGFLEVLVVGYEYQIDDQFAIGCKANLAAPPQMGLGFKGSYFFDRTGKDNFLLCNVMNFEVSGLAVHEHGGMEAELTVGHELIDRNRVGFLFLVGCSYGISTGYRGILYGSLKLGVHYNF
jgi:hypothetical protein